MISAFVWYAQFLVIVYLDAGFGDYVLCVLVHRVFLSIFFRDGDLFGHCVNLQCGVGYGDVLDNARDPSVWVVGILGGVVTLWSDDCFARVGVLECSISDGLSALF